MAYTAWSVVFGEQPTAAKWNQLGANDAGFKDASNIDAEAITPAKIANRTRYVSFGYSKVAMGASGATTGVPLAGCGVPADWVAGTNIVIKCSSRNNVGSGVAVRRFDSYRFRDAAALLAIDSALNINRTISNTNVAYNTLSTLSASNLAAGDKIGVIVSRLGDDGGDTNGGIEDVDNVWMEYTADC